MSNYIKELPSNAVQVKGALNWVTPDGKLFGKETRTVPSRWNNNRYPHKHYGEYFQYSTTVNNHNGYVYGPIKYITDNGYEMRQRRLHIIIAEAFIPNPDGLPIVGHKNNIKTQINVENLYWTTYKENTQKAVDEGLLKNDKSYDDSQSIPVVMFDTYTNKELGRYGSGREAERQTGVGLNTIMRQCKYKKPVRKPFYFRFQSDESIEPPPIVIEYDYYTDEEIGRYANSGEAYRKTGINSKNISQQCRNNFKPKCVTKSKTYFLYSKQR